LAGSASRRSCAPLTTLRSSQITCTLRSASRQLEVGGSLSLLTFFSFFLSDSRVELIGHFDHHVHLFVITFLISLSTGFSYFSSVVLAACIVVPILNQRHVS
jgi:hypothetical protein